MKKAFLALMTVMWLAAFVYADEPDLSNARKKEIVYAMYADYKKEFPGVVDVEPSQAMQLLEEDRVVFIDTRKPAEMDVSQLPTAVSKDRFLADIDRYRGKILIGYCTISYRSGIFAREMAERGIQIRNLKGGILAWTLEGGTVYHDGTPVQRIHVYGDQWDYAPRGYEAVKFSLWEQLFEG